MTLSRPRWVGASLALMVMGPMLWVLSSLIVRLVYDERVPILSERLFRSRDIYDVNFYLELTARGRLALAGWIFGVGLLIGLRAIRDGSGTAGLLGRYGWRGARGLVTWSPASGRVQAGVVLASGAGLALASGYRAVPSLGNDVVTYMPVARKYFDEAYLLGDLPIRDSDGALMAWGGIIRILSVPFGFEGAFFVVSLLGGAILAYGIHRLVSTVLGAGHRAGMLAATLGLTLTFGSFGYSLSVPSHAAFYPTPRFLAIALSVVAISLVLERAFVRGVSVGLVSTAVNTLDGLVPVGLAILAVLLVGDAQPSSRYASRRLARVAAVAALAVTSAAFVVRSQRLPGASTLAELLPGSLVIVTVGSLVGLTGWLIATTRRSWRASGQGQALVAGMVMAIGGALLASRRSAGGRGEVLDGVRAFETVLVQVRQSSSMLVLSATSVSSALLFVALLLATLALLLDANAHPSTAGSDRPREQGALHAVAMLSVLCVGFVALGSNLMERTELPFLVTLWPVRVAWLVVLAFVAVLAIRLEQRGLLRRVGLLPALLVGLIILQGVTAARLSWSVGLLALSCVWVFAHGTTPAGWPLGNLVRRPAVQVLAVAATLVAMGTVVGSLAAPELRVADSMDRLEASGGSNAEIVQMARAANASTPPDARILIPPDPAWGAFRLLSERGVAFEWKNFLTAQPLEWYQQLRWMCDPEYRIDESEDFTVGGRDIAQCHADLSTIDIHSVADTFDADYAVIRGAIAQGMKVVGISESGEHALVLLR